MAYPDPYGQPYGVGGPGYPPVPPGYPPVPPGYPYPGGYGPGTPEEPSATTAMVLGIVSLLCCGPVGIAAIIVGRKSKRAIAASGNTLGGAGKASAGEICGWIAVAVAVIGLLFTVIVIVFGVARATWFLSSVSTDSGSYPA